MRQLNKRVKFTEYDRTILVDLALPIRNKLRKIKTIFKPETLLKWHRDQKRKKWMYNKNGNTTSKKGRPGITKEKIRLVLKLNKEVKLSPEPIAGKMCALGHQISETTVRNILLKYGYPINPKRKGLSWKEFINSHMKTMWASDFFTEEIWTNIGLVRYYVLFFIHLKSRQVYIAGVTNHPTGDWMKQQARNFSMMLENRNLPCTHLLHDRDPLYFPFDKTAKTMEIKIIKSPRDAPRANAYAERFVRETRETLNQFIICGEKHLRLLVKEIEKYHNFGRPHQGINNKIPCQDKPPNEPVPLEFIGCKEYAGGLLKHYYDVREAA